MDFKFDMPTAAFFGRGAVEAHTDKLALGKRAFILTGANSGRASGALADVTAALDKLNTGYDIFEGVGNNPNIAQCRELGASAREKGADFIIGIGGGSPLDAAKAVAVFASNDISDDELFKNKYQNVLPIAAIPTTSGTGSEVTPWSIMTVDDKRTKISFGSHATFPSVALLDPKYTESLSKDITFDTGMDAFEHCFESLVSMRSTPVTDALNISALSIFKRCMNRLEKGDHGPIRERLMTVSMMGGMTISQTGTTLMHAMGYPLTYFKGIPHGRANCVVMPAYLNELERHCPAQLKIALTVLDMTKDELIAYVRRNVKDTVQITESELRLWAEQTSLKNPAATTGTPGDPAHLMELFREVVSVTPDEPNRPAAPDGEKAKILT